MKKATAKSLIRYMKRNDLNHVRNIYGDGTNLIDLEVLSKEYTKWNNMKIPKYKKSWKTRIKNKRSKLQQYINELMESAERMVEIGYRKEGTHVDLFDAMGTLDPRYLDPNDSPYKNKWLSLVKQYYQGNEQAALNDFEQDKLFHDKNKR